MTTTRMRNGVEIEMSERVVCGTPRLFHRACCDKCAHKTVWCTNDVGAVVTLDQHRKIKHRIPRPIRRGWSRKELRRWT